MYKKFPFFQRVVLCSATYFVIFMVIIFLDEKRFPFGNEWWKPVLSSVAGGVLISLFDRPNTPWNKKKKKTAAETSSDNH